MSTVERCRGTIERGIEANGESFAAHNRKLQKGAILIQRKSVNPEVWKDCDQTE
jgi:hypothetical protein